MRVTHKLAIIFAVAGALIGGFGFLLFVQTIFAAEEPDASGWAWSETFGWIAFNSENDFGIPIEQSSDDAYHDPDSWPDYSHTNGNNGVFAGSPGSSGQATWGGFRWTGLGISDNANILGAYVRLRNMSWGHQNIVTTLAFQKDAAPPTFSSANSPYHRWPNRTGEFDWVWGNEKEDPSEPGTWWIRTPSVAGQLQELVGLFGSLDALVLLEDGTGVSAGESHSWFSYDGNPNLAARLYLSWEDPISGESFSNLPGEIEGFKTQSNFTTGVLKGYAWSPHFGWISFDRDITGLPPESPTDLCGDLPTEECIARVDMTLGGDVCGGNQYDICGWARVISACQDNLWDGSKCTGSGAGNRAGGWDGWIKLRGVWDDGAGNSGNYGLVWKKETQEVEGWAWSGNANAGEGPGWISFNSRTSGGTPSYAVLIDLNARPDAVNLQPVELAPSAVYCGSNTAVVRLEWDFEDANLGDTQDAFQVLARENDNCLAGGCPTHINSCPGNDSLTANPTGGTCGSGNVVEFYIPKSGNILNDVTFGHPFFNRTLVTLRSYYWAVRVKDNRGQWSKWSEWAPVDPPTGPGVASFRTIRHRAPEPSFEMIPQNPTLGEVVELRDASRCWCSSINNINLTNVEFACRDGTPSFPAACGAGAYSPRYVWDFGDGRTCDSDSDPSCRGNQQVAFDDLAAGQTVTLTITEPTYGNFCAYAQSFNVGIPFPDWREISPF